jgi:hypothetical protein
LTSLKRGEFDNIHMNIKKIVFLVLIIWISQNLQAEDCPPTPVYKFCDNVQPIYDARVSPQPARLSSAEEMLMNETILSAAHDIWRDRECSADFEILDSAQGSFTEPRSDQKAVLYRYCMTGHNFALNGIAIIENDQVVAHIVYEGTWDYEIDALPDMNGNGLSEMLVAAGGTNMGETWGVIALCEFDGHGIKKIGHTDTYADNCGIEHATGAEASRLYARVGKTPVFYRETFMTTCTGDDPWKKSGAIEQIVLQGDLIEYLRIQ